MPCHERPQSIFQPRVNDPTRRSALAVPFPALGDNLQNAIRQRPLKLQRFLCRRLARLMHELGWSPIKARGLTPGGFRDQVRGYARDTTRQTKF